MSAKCPKCKSVLDDPDFGIKVCGNAACGAMLFVDFDGTVSLSGEDTPAAPVPVPMMQVRSHLDSASSMKEETYFTSQASVEPEPATVPEVVAVEAEPFAAFEDEFAPQIPDGPPGGFPQASFETETNADQKAIEAEVAAYDFEGALQPTNQEEPEQQQADVYKPEPQGWMTENGSNEETMALGAIPPPPADLVAQSEAEGAEAELNEAEWNDEPLGANFTTPEEMNIPTENTETVDFSDVVDFGNSQQLDNNPLAYTLRVYGVDTRRIRTIVDDVLKDPRLNFHLSDVLKGLKGGVLTIHNLPPVKASFIATRLRAEAVEFRWRQEVFGSGQEETAEGGAA